MKAIRQVTERPASILGVALPVEDWACIRRTKLPHRTKVAGASGCREALAHLAKRRTDIVIATPAMSDGTWRELVIFCREIPDPPAVIVASRLADERLWSEVLNLGGYDLVAQPLDPRDLASTLISAMQERTSGQARRMACK